MKKKILLIALAVILLLGCGIGAWLHFRQEDKPDDGGWTWPHTRPDGGSLSEYGYYYIPKDGKILTFMDFATGGNATLCSRVACSHNSPDCDAYMAGASCLFSHGEHVYYLYSNGLDRITKLYRRDATGMAMVEIGVLGEQFIEEQKAVTVSRYAPAGGWLYYSAYVTSEVEEEPGQPTVLQEMTYIGRIHLTTGKNEVLLEDENSNPLRLCAVRDGSVLVHRHETAAVNRDDPDYLEQLRQANVTLERWDEETGKVTVLFRKKRLDCLEIQMVAGNQLYCLTTGMDGSRGDNYTYDLETGEEKLIAEDASYWHLGGGYAFIRSGSEEKRELVNLKTGQTLENGLYEITDGAASVVTMSGQGVVLQYIIDFGNGTGEIQQSYVAYDSLTDGLQVADLQPAYALKTNISNVPSTTQPTNPTEPEKDSNEWDWKPLVFAEYPQPPEESIVKSTQYLPETVENPDNLPVLKWVFAMHLMDRTWTQDAVVELNRMLANRNMPFRVQFVVLMSHYHNNTISGGPYSEYDLLASAEAQKVLRDADLIFGCMTPDQMQALLSPITEYVKGDAQPTLQNSVAHRLDWLATTINGEIYGIKQSPVKCGYDGWYVDKALMEKARLTAADFQKEFWEMDAVFEKLYEANGNKPFMNITNISYTHSLISGVGVPPATPLPNEIYEAARLLYQGIGVCFAIDDSGEAPKVVNLLEKIQFLQEAVLRYTDAGYCSEYADSVNFGVTGITSLEDGPTEYNGKIAIPVTMGRFDSHFGETDYGMNGVAAVSQHKEEAVQLLNLLAEDKAFRNQFLYGKEGRDYTVADGEISPIKGEDGSCYSMVYGRNSLYGYARLSDTEALQDYRDGVAATESVAYPIVFDYTGFDEELAKIGEVLGKYYRVFVNNREQTYTLGDREVTEPKMDDTVYNEMLQALTDAGADEIQAELQRQLDEWIANNPDWNK